MSTLRKISSARVRNLFVSRWPDITTMWITDTEYIVPTLKEVRKAIEKNAVSHFKATPKICECEDYSLILTANIRKARIEVLDLLEEEERLNWAFGFCGLSQYRGAPFNHTICFSVTSSGLYFFDAQYDDSGWKPSEKNDKVYAMFM